MSLMLQLTPELEAEARKAAAREGVPPEAFVVAALEERLGRPGGSSAAHTESWLLEQIGAGLSSETWKRYHELTAKRRAATLTDSEYPELLDLTDEVEAWNVRRLELLLQLARLRGKPLQVLVEELGLAPAPYV